MRRKAVHCAGLDIGVHRSDRRSRVGKLTRQGSPQLRWALFEAAQSACRPQSPAHADYLQLKARGLSHVRASMTIAGKFARLLPHRPRARPATQLDRLAVAAGVRRRFAPHQLRHPHAIERAHEGVSLNVIQRQLGTPTSA